MVRLAGFRMVRLDGVIMVGLDGVRMLRLAGVRMVRLDGVRMVRLAGFQPVPTMLRKCVLQGTVYPIRVLHWIPVDVVIQQVGI
jgi:hypothetical protein